MPGESSCVYNSHGTAPQGAALVPLCGRRGRGPAPAFDGESRSCLRVFSANEGVKNLLTSPWGKLLSRSRSNLDGHRGSQGFML